MKQLDMMGQFEQLGARRILSVSQIVYQIKSRLETGFRDVWVQGEVSNLRIPPSGHLYFTLKDSAAQIPAVCFRMRRRYLKFLPEDGMELLARGSISVYAPRGQVQLMVSHLEPLGRGALQVAFEQLKERLSKEGLFDPAYKLKLPLFPAKVGVVTSPSGAAVRDILRVLQERNDRVGILIYPATVQGPTAPPQIAEGIRELARRPDVDAIIIARGGGSTEDLWAFNDEALARTIFASRVPVISAVGHETDFTIADFVADVRAATPSAAAEAVSAAREELAQRTAHLEKRALQGMSLILHRKQERLRTLTASRGFVDAETRLKFFLQRLDELHGRFHKALPAFLAPIGTRLEQSSTALGHRMDLYLKELKHRLGETAGRLQAYSPLAVLERGYAIITTGSGQVVREAAQVSDRELVQVRTGRGSFMARREDEREI